MKLGFEWEQKELEAYKTLVTTPGCAGTPVSSVIQHLVNRLTDYQQYSEVFNREMHLLLPTFRTSLTLTVNTNKTV